MRNGGARPPRQSGAPHADSLNSRGEPVWLTLVGITDDLRDGAAGLLDRAKAAVGGGVTCVQVRLKNESPRSILAVTRLLVENLGVPVIVNDRADIAIAARAAGAHVGEHDLTVKAVRTFAPASYIVGASLGSPDEAPNADFADYVGIGPVAATMSKADAGDAIGSEGFAKLRRLVRLPAIAVGGVSEANAAALMKSGATGVAVMSAIFSSSDPEAAASRIRSAIGK